MATIKKSNSCEELDDVVMHAKPVNKYQDRNGSITTGKIPARMNKKHKSMKVPPESLLKPKQLTVNKKVSATNFDSNNSKQQQVAEQTVGGLF